MRSLTLTLAVLVGMTSTSLGRIVPSRTYQELLDESNLVLIVNAKATRPPRADDIIVPLEYVAVGMRGLEVHPLNPEEMGRFTAVVTEFDVLAVVKGRHAPDTLKLCHYTYKTGAQGLRNGPSFVKFSTERSTELRENYWIDGVANNFVLFLKRDSKNRLTFVTGQYDPIFSVKQITSPRPSM